MRLYTIDTYIADKAMKENKRQSQVRKELSEYLDISEHSLGLIRRMEASGSARISKRVVKIAAFFDVPIDALINPAAKEVLLQN